MYMLRRFLVLVVINLCISPLFAQMDKSSAPIKLIEFVFSDLSTEYGDLLTLESSEKSLIVRHYKDTVGESMCKCQALAFLNWNYLYLTSEPTKQFTIYGEAELYYNDKAFMDGKYVFQQKVTAWVNIRESDTSINVDVSAESLQFNGTHTKNEQLSLTSVYLNNYDTDEKETKLEYDFQKLIELLKFCSN